VYLGYRAIAERNFVRVHAAGLLALAFGAVVFLAPMAAVIARSPASFTARTSGVLITSPPNLEHELDGYHVGTLQEVLAMQTQHTLEAFNIRGETSLQYGQTSPLLDSWSGGLLAMSVLAILLRLGSARGVLLASWVWLTLIVGSVLTIDALFSPRALPALPGLLLGCALMVDSAWRGVERLIGRAGTYAVAAPVIVVLALALKANVHDYFDVQVVERQPANRFSLLAAYAQTIVDQYRIYTIGHDDWSMNSEAPRFVAPNADAVNVRDTPLGLPLAHLPANKGVAFVVENGAADFSQRMALIQQTYPRGRQEIIAERTGHPVFTSYLVDNAELAAVNPRAERD
jgi:hypothetical protein